MPLKGHRVEGTATMRNGLHTGNTGAINKDIEADGRKFPHCWRKYGKYGKRKKNVLEMKVSVKLMSVNIDSLGSKYRRMYMYVYLFTLKDREWRQREREWERTWE